MYHAPNQLAIANTFSARVSRPVIRNAFALYLHAQTPGGKQGRSEFGSIPYSALVSIGVTFHM